MFVCVGRGGLREIQVWWDGRDSMSFPGEQEIVNISKAFDKSGFKQICMCDHSCLTLKLCVETCKNRVWMLVFKIIPQFV